MQLYQADRNEIRINLMSYVVNNEQGSRILH